MSFTMSPSRRSVMNGSRTGRSKCGCEDLSFILKYSNNSVISVSSGYNVSAGGM